MSDREFDALASQSLAPEPGCNERIWSEVVRRRRSRWVPTIPETLFASAFAALVLAALVYINSRPYLAVTPTFEAKSIPQPPIEATFNAVSHIEGLPPTH